MDFFDAFYEQMNSIQREKERHQEEFLRLCAEPCLRAPAPGDRVIVAAGLIGRGYPWAREEASVLEVGDTSVRVRYASLKSCGGEILEEWVHPALITDVLGPAHA